jgi:hypothetical protein
MSASVGGSSNVACTQREIIAFSSSSVGECTIAHRGHA